jgi:hypothetical protein
MADERKQVRFSGEAVAIARQREDVVIILPVRTETISGIFDLELKAGHGAIIRETEKDWTERDVGPAETPKRWIVFQVENLSEVAVEQELGALSCPNCGGTEVTEWDLVPSPYRVTEILIDEHEYLYRCTIETADSGKDLAWDGAEPDEWWCDVCEWQSKDPVAFVRGTWLWKQQLRRSEIALPHRQDELTDKEKLTWMEGLPPCECDAELNVNDHSPTCAHWRATLKTDDRIEKDEHEAELTEQAEIREAINERKDES